MPDNYLISVVIPVYNAELTIEQAISSVVNQTYSNIEIIIVNDGSSDTSAQVIRSIPYPIKYIEQENLGAAVARNNGVLKAQGKYVAFLDADDVWHKSKLSLQIKAFEKYPELSFCSTNKIRANRNDYERYINNDIEEAKILLIDDFKIVFQDPYFGTPSVMMLKQFFLDIGGLDAAFKTAEDIDLWLRSSYDKTIGIIQAPLTVVIGVDGSLQDREGTSFEDHLLVIDKFCESHREFSRINFNLVNSMKSIIYTNMGSSKLIEGKVIDARECFSQALKFKITLRPLYLYLKTLIKLFVF